MELNQKNINSFFLILAYILITIIIVESSSSQLLSIIGDILIYIGVGILLILLFAFISYKFLTD